MEAARAAVQADARAAIEIQWQAAKNRARAAAATLDAEQEACKAAREAYCKATNVCTECMGRADAVCYNCVECGNTGKYCPRVQS
jgi:hypothetical protein